jgi:hypothetical protein
VRHQPRVVKYLRFRGFVEMKFLQGVCQGYFGGLGGASSGRRRQAGHKLDGTSMRIESWRPP